MHAKWEGGKKLKASLASHTLHINYFTSNSLLTLKLSETIIIMYSPDGESLAGEAEISAGSEGVAIYGKYA